MFNIDLVNILLKRKEDSLQVLSASQNVNQSDIDNLNKEINYLKSLVVRYEIAKLLHLDSNTDYSSINYFGIEEEDVNQFNLTATEKNEYNNLVSQLPKEQLSRYKIRRQLAKIINTDNIDGIENINPHMTKYGLSQGEIKEFEDLVNTLNGLPKDTTKAVSLNALKVIKDAFDKLNIDDSNEYNRIKGTYLDIIDKLIKDLDKDKKDLAFSRNTCNYEFASDLLKKYPDLNVKLDLKGVEDLLDLLENNSDNMSQEDYEAYLNLVSSSINLLYKEDSNKQQIENLINNIDKLDYTLRYDLKNKLCIENVNLDLQDDELEDAFYYLNDNYSTLSENDRNKCYGLVKSKISSNVSDFDKLKEINDLMKTVSSSEFLDTLRNDFSNNENIEFRHQHLNSYQSLLNDEIKKLEEKKSKYESKKVKSGLSNAHWDAKIREVEKAIENLSSIKNDYSNSDLIDRLDIKYNEKTDKMIELKKEVAELQKLKESVKSRFYKSIIDKKIEKRNKKISKLQESKVKIVGKQKKIMAPKLWLASKNGTMDRHFEARSEVFQSYSDDFQKMADAEKNLNSMFSGIKSAFYEHKANKYQSKADFNQSICAILNGSTVTITGSNRQSISRNLLDKIRQRQQSQVTQTI